jgi:hypothetical protein
MAFNALWFEGAISVADAGVNRGINQLSANTTTSVVAYGPTAIPAGSVYTYRSGRKTDLGAQPLQYVGLRYGDGYSIAQCATYSSTSCGYKFMVYQVNATGTGPRNAQREVELQAQFGPVP